MTKPGSAPAPPTPGGEPVTPNELPMRVAIAPKALQATDDEAQFVPLPFARDLPGWEVHDGKSESWMTTDGVLSCVVPGGGWLRTTRPYGDFVLRIDYRISSGGNTGIAFRFPGEGNPALNGFELQLIDDASRKYARLQPDQYTGSIYYQAPPRVSDAAHKAGEWNSVEIICAGARIQALINGTVVNDVALDREQPADSPKRLRTLADRPLAGYIALQSHLTRVDFRRARIRDLSQETASGLRYYDVAAGDGNPVPPNATVTVHYVGQLTDGKTFDSSRARGAPVTLPLSAVIAGWREGIPGMKVGGRRKLIVPPQLAYGQRGVRDVIPADATLVFDIELTGFEAP